MNVGRYLAVLGLSVWAFSSAAAQQPEGMEPGPPHETRLVVGELPPATPPLTSVTDGEIFDLAAQRGTRPILLHFFRGTW